MKVLVRGGTLDVVGKPASNALALEVEHENATGRYRFAVELEAAEAVKVQDRIRDELTRILVLHAGQPGPSYLAAQEELERTARDYTIAIAASCPDLEVADKRARFHRAAVAFAEEARAYR